jgi:hypothetical protein
VAKLNLLVQEDQTESVCDFFYLSQQLNTNLKSKMMFQLLMKKIFLFTPTVYLFGAEIGITEMRQILKKTGPAVSRNEFRTKTTKKKEVL